MEQPDQYNWTILYTDHQKQFIHFDHLKDSNPKAQIIKVDISNNYKYNYIWRNADILVREWLRVNYTNIIYNNIAILDWDVLITDKLPQISINGLMAANIRKPNVDRKWYWFKDILKLEKYIDFAIGAAPLAVLFMNKQCINIWLDSEFDVLYKKDIFSELRLPTILNSKNINIQKYNLPYVHHKKITFKSDPGIYHPIKYHVL